MKSFASLLLVAAGLTMAVPAIAADYTLAVNYNTNLGTIQPEVMGFNAIYSNEPDAQWNNGTGNVPNLLANLSTKLVRFPAGTVVTFWHWNDPNVPGHVDSWDPAYNHANDKPASATMNIDEYLAYCAAKGTTPLVGINMGSGKRWNRVNDGINEAKALVQHCMASGVDVKYYYLDNEPYQPDANYPFTPEEYAAQVNLYAPALKSVNPNIKIIVNLHPSPTKTAYTQTVVQLAGQNIDYVDLHFYWRYNTATFANWINEPQMTNQGAQPYAAQRQIYRTMFANAGFPNIDLAVLEWNVGPFGSGNPEPSEAENALMAGEQFMQLVGSGVPLMSCWPLHWESGDWHRAVISSAQGYTPNKMYDMFQQFSTIGWRQQVSGTIGGTAAQNRLTYLLVKTNDAQTVYVYLINKNQATATSSVDLDLTSFTGFNAQSAVGFESTDTSVGPLNVHSIPVTKTGNHLTFSMPKNSFAKVTVTRPAQQTTVSFTPVKDAMVKAAAATSNFGAATNMQCSGQSGFAKQMFLQFNVSGLPAGATIVSATLTLNPQASYTGHSIAAHTAPSTSWGETTITWNNKPSPLGAQLGSAVSNFVSGTDAQWNVTSAVTGNGNISFALDSTFSGDTNLNAREAGAGTSPALIIVYQ